MSLHLVTTSPPRPAPRKVPLTADLLAMAAACATDPYHGEMASRPAIAQNMLQPGLSYAFMEGGLLLGVCGLIPTKPGSCGGWLLITVHARLRHLAHITREIDAFFTLKQRDPMLARIEFHIRADAPWRESFAKRLGMTEGFGPMKKWDPRGLDYWQYARVA